MIVIANLSGHKKVQKAFWGGYDDHTLGPINEIGCKRWKAIMFGF